MAWIDRAQALTLIAIAVILAGVIVFWVAQHSEYHPPGRLVCQLERDRYEHYIMDCRPLEAK